MRDVRSINPDKYSVEEVGRTITNGVTSVVTELTITSVGVTDSGMVRCEARIPPSEASGSVPATTFADTTLTVLGMCVHNVHSSDVHHSNRMGAHVSSTN